MPLWVYACRRHGFLAGKAFWKKKNHLMHTITYKTVASNQAQKNKRNFLSTSASVRNNKTITYSKREKSSTIIAMIIRSELNKYHTQYNIKIPVCTKNSITQLLRRLFLLYFFTLDAEGKTMRWKCKRNKWLEMREDLQSSRPFRFSQ